MLNLEALPDVVASTAGLALWVWLAYAVARRNS